MNLHQITSPLLDYIFMVEKRPPMYIGSYSVETLRNFLYGWRYHREMFPDGDKFADHFFEDFHQFVADVYGETRSIGWDMIIEYQAASEQDEFKLFMVLLRKYLKKFPKHLTEPNLDI